MDKTLLKSHVYLAEVWRCYRVCTKHFLSVPGASQREEYPETRIFYANIGYVLAETICFKDDHSLCIGYCPHL